MAGVLSEGGPPRPMHPRGPPGPGSMPPQTAPGPMINNNLNNMNGQNTDNRHHQHMQVDNGSNMHVGGPPEERRPQEHEGHNYTGPPPGLHREGSPMLQQHPYGLPHKPPPPCPEFLATGRCGQMDTCRFRHIDTAQLEAERGGGIPDAVQQQHGPPNMNRPPWEQPPQQHGFPPGQQPPPIHHNMNEPHNMHEHNMQPPSHINMQHPNQEPEWRGYPEGQDTRIQQQPDIHMHAHNNDMQVHSNDMHAQNNVIMPPIIIEHDGYTDANTNGRMNNDTTIDIYNTSAGVVEGGWDQMQGPPQDQFHQQPPPPAWDRSDSRERPPQHDRNWDVPDQQHARPEEHTDGRRWRDGNNRDPPSPGSIRAGLRRGSPRDLAARQSSRGRGRGRTPGRGGTPTTHTGRDRPRDSGAEPETVRARHILIKHSGSRKLSSWRDPNGIEMRQRSKEDAIAILRDLQNRWGGIPPEAVFADVASKMSDCSSANRGGDLGSFPRGKMQRSFDKAAFALNRGEVSGVIDTDSGVHLIMRTG